VNEGLQVEVVSSVIHGDLPNATPRLFHDNLVGTL
jgi:hypothetical protein